MKYILIIVVIFIIFCAWLKYEQGKAAREAKKKSDEFWEKESKANSTRNKDFSDLPLLNVSPDEIPVAQKILDNESVSYYIDQIKEIINGPLIDLSDYSNTDLKLAYGVGNFKQLSEYDENFNTFLMLLSNLARAYKDIDENELAKDTYLLAIHYGSKKRSDFTELAKVYLAMDAPQKITELIDLIDDSAIERKDGIVNDLRNVLKTYQ